MGKIRCINLLQKIGKNQVQEVVAENWEKLGAGSCRGNLGKSWVQEVVAENLEKNQVHKVVAENWKKIRCRNMGQWYAIEQLMEHAIIYYTATGD